MISWEDIYNAVLLFIVTHDDYQTFISRRLFMALAHVSFAVV